MDEYSLPTTGTARIVETDAFGVLNALKGTCRLEKEGPMCFSGYGEILRSCEPVEKLSLFRLIKESGDIVQSGYIMFHSLEEIFGLILFSKGAPVAAFSAGLSDGTASIMNGKIKNSGELKALAEDLKERQAEEVDCMKTPFKSIRAEMTILVLLAGLIVGSIMYEGRFYTRGSVFFILHRFHLQHGQ